MTVVVPSENAMPLILDVPLESVKWNPVNVIGCELFGSDEDGT